MNNQKITHCPIHKDVWMYQNMLETKGFCEKCQKWYDLEIGDNNG